MKSDFPSSLPPSQLLTLVVFAAALAELVFSIVHAHRLGAAVVAEYQYLSPSILAVTMVTYSDIVFLLNEL